MIIDTSNTIPTREMFFEDIFTPTPGMKDYFRLFGARWSNWLGMTAEDFLAAADKLDDQNFRDMLIKQAEAGPLSMDNFVKQLKEAGITWSAVHNMEESNVSGACVPNEYVADICNKYPGQFIPFTGYNPHKGSESVARVEHAIKNLGFKAVVFRPFIHGCYASDKRYYPLYSLCQSLDVPIWIHSSVNWMQDKSMYFGHPANLEPVLIDFPKLKLIAGHGGWPWVNDMVLLLWKYDNLYADTSAHRPKYLNSPGSGWEMFMRFANSTIQDKILFGSDWLSMGIPIREILAEVDQWPLKDSVKEKFLYKNSLQVFNLP